MDILKTAAIMNSKSTIATSVSFMVCYIGRMVEELQTENRAFRERLRLTKTKSTNRAYRDVCHRTGQPCMLDVNNSEKTVDTCCDKSFMILYGKYSTHTWSMQTMYHVILLDQILLLN